MRAPLGEPRLQLKLVDRQGQVKVLDTRWEIVLEEMVSPKRSGSFVASMIALLPGPFEPCVVALHLTDQTH